MRITFNNLEKSYNGITIFNNISGQIDEGDRIGIIGRNGVGKTTLFKILLGIEGYDKGSLSLSPSNLKIAYLNQFVDFDEGATVFEEIYKEGKEVFSSNLNREGYNRILRQALLQIGFGEESFNQRVVTLSGGEKTKLSICRMLLTEPDVLLLDEPTNHLDMDTIKWLEEFLRGLKKTVIVISHDRFFLDGIATKIFEMNPEEMKIYRGNYSNFKQQREEEIKRTVKEYDKQQREMAHLRNIINERMLWFHRAHKSAGQDDFLRSKSKKHVHVLRSKERQLKRLEENKVELHKEGRVAAFGLVNKSEQEIRLPKYIMEVKNLCKNYGKKAVLDNVNFTLKQGDKLAILGRNGAGKSTLLKVILGQTFPDGGNVAITPSIRLGYLSQELEELNFENTIIQEVSREEVSKEDIRLMLACMLFKGEDINKKVGNLSMGEKCRVAFSKLLLSKPNLLILDEPTNYLDILSRERIEETLMNYEGSIIVISHDRYFIKRIANKVLEVNKGKALVYDGGFDYYFSKKKEEEIRTVVGENYSNIKDEIRRLECELAFVSGRLGEDGILGEEKQELDARFMETARRINQLKQLLRRK